MKNQNKRIRIIYVTGLLVLLIIFLLSYSKYRVNSETKLTGEMVNVSVNKVACSYGVNKSYIVFSYRNSNHIVNIDYKSCENYAVGDSITLLYNKDHDLFFDSQIDTTNEEWGMILSGIMFLFVTLNYFFPKTIKLPFGKQF